MRVGEATALRWEDVDLEAGMARVYRTKTGGKPTDLELSTPIQRTLRDLRAERLRASMRQGRPDEDPLDGLVFTGKRGGAIHHGNFRYRVWAPSVRAAFGPGRHLTPHCLRHTWTSLHMARETPLKWIQEQGGWSSAKMLLDVYGHFMPRETRGYADRIAQLRDPDGPKEEVARKWVT